MKINTGCWVNGCKCFDLDDEDGVEIKRDKEWVGLTDAEYEVMAEQYVTNCYFDTLKYAKAIEAKLKDNNYDND